MTTDAVRAVAAEAPEHVERLMGRVERRLRALVGDRAAVLAPGASATIAAGGKRLRPLLVLLAAGEDVDEDRAARAGVAVELVHSASLVHDDVLDGAVLRRGVPTVIAGAGRQVATATGDLLFALAFGELAAPGRDEDVRVLADACLALSCGELLQRRDAWDATIDPARYLERCTLKTARLFAAACRLGALAGGGPAPALDAFGERIGLAFQVLDDVLDVTGPQERTGKRPGTDLLDGTVTLPLILARERDPRVRAVDVRSIATPAQAESLCARIVATGAPEEARRRALAMVDRAKAELPELPERQRRALELVADGVVDRCA